ncbi:S-layer homology domain-containing protein [Domibacillus sp.]|uniref:S-layer homology domain-containing protein n=1 Tax=Domibacillus sp. TaxID=1969783 RepID=UPI002810D759|nr:S-layer homology domain-containing protein [Domibacillus sp.]
MKKYPFSTKAAKAMIAATIALTPVATTTAGLFGADKAEAAQVQYDVHFNTPQALVDYAKSIYTPIKNDENVVKTVAALKETTATEWNTIAQPVLQIPGADPTEVQNAAALLHLLLNKQTGVLTTENVQQFITVTRDNFNGATEEDYLQYLENVEEAIYEYYVTNGASVTSEPTFNMVKGILTAVQSAEDPSEDDKIRSEIVRTIKTDDTSVRAAVELLETTLEGHGANETVVKAAGQQFALQWLTKYGYTPSTGGGGGVTPPPPVPVQPNPDGSVVVTPVPTEGTNEVVVTIPAAVESQIVAATPANAPAVVIEVPNREDGKPVVLDIPASLAAAIQAKAPAADIVIDAGDVKYVIPLSKVDLTALAAGLGGNLSALTLRINIDELTAAEANSLEDLIQAKAAGTAAASSETKAASIVSGVEVKAPAVKVKVQLAQNGTVLSELKSFGNVYVNQELTIDGSVNTNNATGVVVAADGSLKALPTTFKTEDGKQVAVVGTLANTDGVYTVIESSVTFPDVNNGKNWAEKYIETLSSKFIIAGTTAGTYKPDQDMTRSQFAVLLSRALGLPGTTAYDGRFKDVKGDEWFNTNGEFMAAVKYGIIAGKPNGTFAPNDKVTRAEAAAMIGRALELDFINFDESQLNKSKKLADFKDVKEIGASTRAEVLKVYQAGIMSGASNKEFNPNDYTKRDQMARILAEFLIKANLMENIK